MTTQLPARSDSDGFQLVTRRGRRRARALGARSGVQPARRVYSGPSREELFTTLDASRADMEASQFYKEFLSLTREPLDQYPGFSEVVCYGIGCVGESRAAQHQTAFLLALQRHWRPESVWVFDPQLLEEECSVLRQFGCQIITRNEACKRAVTVPTLFFMPHCGRAMYNNLLWANWSPERLGCTAIIGNRFSSYLERLPVKQLEKEAPFIYHVIPHTTEHALPWHKFSDPHSFTDTSLHTFTPHTLPPSLWALAQHEPTPDPTNPEMITGPPLSITE